MTTFDRYAPAIALFFGLFEGRTEDKHGWLDPFRNI